MDFKNLFREYVIPWFFLSLGAVLAAFSLEEFLVPATILDGGVTGISMILHQLTAKSLSLFILVLNVPFLLVGFQQFGKWFVVRAAYAMALFSAMLEVFRPMEHVTEDPLLAVVFGGLLLGTGVGLVLRSGGCLDGTETVALLISKKFGISLGQIVLFMNVIIYGCAGLLFGWDRALYSLLTYFISSKVIDMVEEGLEQGKAAMIITDCAGEIADAIYTRLGRTCTLLHGEGLISGHKVVLYCVVTRMEIPEIRKILKEQDISSFMTVTDLSEIYGNHIKQFKEENDS
ncbi:MAG: YitT family protein [Lachnospiraceae bacterium]|nr:YitT family protein [Lachnospiraceae bacterium]